MTIRIKLFRKLIQNFKKRGQRKNVVLELGGFLIDLTKMLYSHGPFAF